jgi:hypothetical protein
LHRGESEIHLLLFFIQGVERLGYMRECHNKSVAWSAAYGVQGDLLTGEERREEPGRKKKIEVRS